MNLDPCVFVVICIIAVITTCKCVLHEKGVSLLVCFVFFQIGRIVENSEAVSEILNNVELLKQIVYCIGGENLSVAKVVSSLSANCARHGVLKSAEKGCWMICRIKVESNLQSGVRHIAGNS